MESKKEVIDSILETVRGELEAFVKEESRITSSLEYEERLLQLGRHFMRTTIEKSMGEKPKSRNSKKKS